MLIWERQLHYQGDTENQGRGLWPEVKVLIPNQPMAHPKRWILLPDVCSTWEGKRKWSCPCKGFQWCFATLVSVLSLLSNQAPVSYHTGWAALPCILKPWCLTVYNARCWLEFTCFVEIQVVITQLPAIGNRHQGNLRPPISTSGNWLLNVVDENTDMANGIWARTGSAAILVRQRLEVHKRPSILFH